MNDCITFWRRSMSLMQASRRCTDRRTRSALVSEAYEWLNRWFDAVEHEVARNPRLALR